jgi:hypothetical protein
MYVIVSHPGISGLETNHEVTMNQYEQQQIEQPTSRGWWRLSTLSALIGGILMTITGIALLSVLTVAEFVVIDPIGITAMVLLAVALPALYVSERHWFGRLAKTGFGLMTVGWIVSAIALPIAEYGPGSAFLAFLLGLLVAMIGAFVFGIAILRTNAKTVPRASAWLLVAALPIGLPFAIGFTTYVMGQGADPWAGPMLLYGLAWIIFGRYCGPSVLRPPRSTWLPSRANSLFDRPVKDISVLPHNPQHRRKRAGKLKSSFAHRAVSLRRGFSHLCARFKFVC